MMRQNDRSRQARAIVSVNAVVLAALCLGLLSNVLIAALFGLTHHVDAFFAAAVLPNLFMYLCLDYLGKNFLPVLASAKAISPACVDSVTSSVVTIVAVLAAAVMAALLVFREPLFAAMLPGFDAEVLEVVSRYFVIMAPSIVLMAVNTFHEYVWQYEERFTYVSLSRAALPVANLLGLLFLAPWLGYYCLPVAHLLGHAAAFVLLMRRIPYRYRPQIALRPGFERRVFGNSAIVMSTGLLARSKSIIVSYLGSQLGPGVITALALASKLTEPLERSAFTGIRMLMFSTAVRLNSARDRHGLGALYSNGLRASFLVLAPLLWWIALDSKPIVEALFQHGRFTPEMAALVAAVLVGLVPSVLFVGVNHLLSNAFYAMDRVMVPAVVMPLGTLVYLAIAIPLTSWLGAQALAIATSTATMILFAVLLLILARQLPQIGLLRTAGELVFYAVLAGTAMLVAVAGLARLEMPPLAVAAAALPLGTAAYAAALYYCGDRTFHALFEIARTYAARGLKISADRRNRNSKAPPAPKTD
jgi:putative peptidoglycan lipid II flippase